VEVTCRWFAGALVTFNYPSGPVRQAGARSDHPTEGKAYEELVERRSLNIRVVLRKNEDADFSALLTVSK
jgi:hypothetical protein